jgi:hypothetical protein
LKRLKKIARNLKSRDFDLERERTEAVKPIFHTLILNLARSAQDRDEPDLGDKWKANCSLKPFKTILEKKSS